MKRRESEVHRSVSAVNEGVIQNKVRKLNNIGGFQSIGAGNDLNRGDQFADASFVNPPEFRQPAPITTGARAEMDLPEAYGGVIVQLGVDEYLVACTGTLV